MKTTTYFYWKKFTLLCFFILCYSGFAQTEGANFNVTLENVTNPTPTTLEFDIKLTVSHTGTALADGGIKIAGISYAVMFNPAILNGGTPSNVDGTGSYVLLPGTRNPIFNSLDFSGPNGSGNFRGVFNGYGQLRVIGTVLSGASSVLFPNGTYIIGRYRFTNTVPWATNVDAQLWLNAFSSNINTNPASGGPGSTSTLITGYRNNTTTPSYVYSAATPAANPGIVLGYSKASPLSLVLNAPCSLTTTWGGTSWSPFEPVADQAAVIAGNFSSTGDISACSLTVNSGTVTVNSGHDFSIAGAVTVNGGSLTFENNANLIQVSDVDNAGAITVKRNASMKRLDYVYWGSPVAGQDLKLFSPYTVSPINAPGFPTPVGASRFYTLDEPTNNFQVIAAPLGTNFEEAKGYMLRAPNNFPANGAVATFNGIFTGVPHNGNATPSISNSGAGKGFNMLANPYPSTISADLFLLQNPGELYFWAHFDSTQPSGANYATYTTFGAAAVAGGATPDGQIAVGQGFVLKTLNNGTATFNNGMRTGTNSAIFFRNATTEKHRIWLNLANASGLQNQILMGYLAGATDDADVSVDARQIESDINNIASVIGDEKFNIQARALPFDDTDEFELSFNAIAAGEFTIAIDHVDGLFAQGQQVFLKDNVLGTVHNLTESAYTFAAQPGTVANRFSVVFQSMPLGIDNPNFDANSIVTFKADNVLNINSGNMMMSSVKVFDIRGRLVFEQSDINANTVALEKLKAEQQVLLVQITSNDNLIVTKKVVH